MTEQEYAHAQAIVAERDNDIADLTQQERECVEQVRLFADGRRQAAAKRISIELATKPLREAMAQHVQEMRKAAAEKAMADAETKAAEPQPPSQIEVLTAEVKRLSELVAAKG